MDKWWDADSRTYTLEIIIITILNVALSFCLFKHFIHRFRCHIYFLFGPTNGCLLQIVKKRNKPCLDYYFGDNLLRLFSTKPCIVFLLSSYFVSIQLSHWTMVICCYRRHTTTHKCSEKICKWHSRRACHRHHWHRPVPKARRRFKCQTIYSPSIRAIRIGKQPSQRCANEMRPCSTTSWCLTSVLSSEAMVSQFTFHSML